MPQKKPTTWQEVKPGATHPQGWDVPPINDLRSAIELLKKHPEQYIETDRETDPIAELAGVYRYVGAGGTVTRPTRKGPAMMFNNIKGFPGMRVLVGLLASRDRVSMMLGAPVRELGIQMAEARRNVTPPVIVKGQQAPCQEVIYRAEDENFDLRTLLPAPTNTREDAGPYFCLGLVLGSDPDDRDNVDVTIHRLCVQGKDELSIFFAPGRHIDAFRQKAEAAGKPLPVSINMGLDPAIPIGAEFEAPTTPFGFDELCVAGGLRGRPIELVECVSVRQRAIARAEIVIEGEILPGVRVAEDQHTHTGKAMPEFPGYTGDANPSLPVIKVKAITTRRNPILQTLVGPGEEHVSLAGIPTEASIYMECEDALPGLIKNVYAHSAGGGKFLAILQVAKRNSGDDGMTRQAALIALAVYRELKNVFLVDEDVDLFYSDDVLWAMQTRFSGDLDTIFNPGIAGHVLDPSQTPLYDPRITAKGTTTKTVYDCTVPFHLREHFVRAQFKELDPTLWVPDLYK
ncbi:TPA: UbiD family decarboxylase [Enterobacter hormaechei subsp. xiangfangensis]|nr:UbiD family decarboxylase [Enterobacter hormaechei subsp. xiangfangensis]HAS0858588.1 UbiD family decarboxylase [Enterobacter hormaechei subsp. xiangfangensis]HAT7689211.1 UbiD family decarboxylase [Enterobacter hormaechei subsp. xiangfangensis]